MARESKRTLYSLTATYQSNVDFEYEVIAIDHGSQERIDLDYLPKSSLKLKYKYIDTDLASPCIAINRAVESVDADFVMCCIDGARILSPGILSSSLKVAQAYANPFIYTLALHIGPKVQKDSILDGYNKDVEDKLLHDSKWEENGYNLFNISTIAPSSAKGYFGCISETNCFVVKRKDFLTLGGYNEKFISPGGGFANIEIFERFVNSKVLSPVVLLGEGTFHQIHGGAITNRIKDRKKTLQAAIQEYERITSKKYSASNYNFECFGNPNLKYTKGFYKFV